MRLITKCGTMWLGVAMLMMPLYAQSADAKSDPVLQAMQAELERSKTLHLASMQTPYFVEYRVEDVDEFEASADYGALTQQLRSHQRILRVTVRIGDYKTDSSTAQGSGTAQLAAVDDDVTALRYGLWVATDEAYKNALRGYSAKQAELKGFETPPTADDFAPAKAIVQIDPLVKLAIDEPLWVKRVAEASGWYASDPAVKDFSSDIQYSVAGVRGVVVNRYLVNSEGAVVRGGHAYYVSSLGASTQAQDGMRLERSYASTGASAQDSRYSGGIPREGDRAADDAARSAQRAGGGRGVSRAGALLRRRGGGCLQRSLCAECGGRQARSPAPRPARRGRTNRATSHGSCRSS